VARTPSCRYRIMDTDGKEWQEFSNRKARDGILVLLILHLSCCGSNSARKVVMASLMYGVRIDEANNVEGR
jgi:hypothetical protein